MKRSSQPRVPRRIALVYTRIAMTVNIVAVRPIVTPWNSAWLLMSGFRKFGAGQESRMFVGGIGFTIVCSRQYSQSLSW